MESKNNGKQTLSVVSSAVEQLEQPDYNASQYQGSHLTTNQSNPETLLVKSFDEQCEEKNHSDLTISLISSVTPPVSGEMTGQVCTPINPGGENVENISIEKEVVMQDVSNIRTDLSLRSFHEIVCLTDPMKLESKESLSLTSPDVDLKDECSDSFEENIDTENDSLKDETTQSYQGQRHSARICWKDVKVNTLKINNSDMEIPQGDNTANTSNEGKGEPCDCLFDLLPEEIITKIFSLIPQKELCKSVSLVSKTWNSASKNPLLWQVINYEEFKQMPSDNLLHVLQTFCPLLKTLSLRCRRDILEHEFQILSESCPLLQELSLAFCEQINEKIISTIGKRFSNLRTLNVEGCELHDECLYKLGNLALEGLNVSHCTNLSDDGLIYVAKTFKNLHHLNFDGVQWITDPAVSILVDCCYQSLQHVWLDGANLTDNSLKKLTKCSKLRTLKLSFCDELSDSSLLWISEMKNLVSLGLKKGVQFSAAGLVEMFKKLHTSITGNPSGLLYLDMTECMAMDDYCIFVVSERFLHSINLSWCWEITDNGIVNLINNCHYLTHINFCGLHGLLGVPFQDIPQQLPSLCLLDLTQCNRVSDDFLVELVNKMSSLVIYDYYGEQVEPDL